MAAMNDLNYIPANERNEMLRAFSGVVTAVLKEDKEAIASQTSQIVSEQARLSGTDLDAFAFRLTKQLEAAARVAGVAVTMLANARGQSVEDTQRVLAETWAFNDFAND